MNRGVPQLKKLTVRWCNWGGSSRGMIEFIQHGLVPFAHANPSCEIVTELKRGRHPCLFAEYVRGFDKAVGVKNRSAQEISAVVAALRDSSGRKMKPMKKPVLSRARSVQGRWTAALP